MTSAEDAIAAFNVEEIRDERAGLETQRTALEKLATLLSGVRRSAHELADAKEREAKARTTADAAEKSAKEAERDGKIATIGLEAAKAKLEAAQAVRDLEAYRAHLREDVPCPLCGSKEHPYERRAPKVDKRIEAAEEEVLAFEKEVKKLLRAAATQAAKHEGALQEAAGHAETAKLRDIEQHRSRRSYGAQHKAFAETTIPADPTTEGTEEAISTRLKDVERRLARTIESEAKATRLQNVAKNARAARDARQVELDAARKARDAAKERLDAAARARADAETKRNAAMEAYERAIEEVSPAFDRVIGWRDAFQKNPRMFERSCAEDVAEQIRLRKSRAEIKTMIASAAPRQIEAKARLAERLNAVAIAHGRTVDGKSAVGALITKRQSLLGGRMTDDVLREIGERVTRARNLEREALEVPCKSGTKARGGRDAAQDRRRHGA